MKTISTFLFFLLFSKIASGVYLASKGSIQHNLAFKSPTSSSITHLTELKTLALAIPLGIMSFSFLTTGSRNVAEGRQNQHLARNLFFLSFGFIGLSGAKLNHTKKKESACSYLDKLRQAALINNFFGENPPERCYASTNVMAINACIFHEQHLLLNRSNLQNKSQQQIKAQRKIMLSNPNELVYSAGFLNGELVITKLPPSFFRELEYPHLYLIFNMLRGYTIISTDQNSDTWICPYY
ncbi:hypothetical protein [Endozoicomonas sp. ALC020]|uniref:hypothetical protein n=1 Tax=unclassified Endozoicomonas TaxID=2644528 RepID=UPI003BAF99DC